MTNRLDSYRWLIVAVLAIPLVAGSILLVSNRLRNEPEPLAIAETNEPTEDLRVYITGAVTRPGVYAVSTDARWIDALEAAGGATQDADLDAINLARRAQDEDIIVVPRMGGSSVVTSSARRRAVCHPGKHQHGNASRT